MDFNIEEYLIRSANKWKSNVQYDEILKSLKLGNVQNIKAVVDKSIRNLWEWKNRFVIYGEPQSGKTNMMIALTARLVDEGYSRIVVLVNDNVQLLQQNLKRFQRSKLKPLPKDIDDCGGSDLSKERSFILFTKKNSSNLQSVYSQTKKINSILVIDDEADYASPNWKVNAEDEQTRINELIGRILWETGSYIWVTATPARLDLNGTFQNSIKDWVDFSPYEWYYWDKIFFPIEWRSTKDNSKLEYRLNLFKDDADIKHELKTAIFNFIINVSYLNCFKNSEELNYCMLVHTSHKTDDQYDDSEAINKVLDSLKDVNHAKFNKSLEEIAPLIISKFEWITKIEIDQILDYIIKEVNWWLVKVINSKEINKNEYIEKLTDPVSPFTFVIGGNILSRGLTFNRLLSMFFLRSTKNGKLQQDTYIQMARMFWNRGEYIKYFELNIRESLFASWREQFDLHRLSISLLRHWANPKWFYSQTSSPASNNSIDKGNTVIEYGSIENGGYTTIDADNKEICSDKFDYRKIESFINSKKLEQTHARDLLIKIQEAVPEISGFIESVIENTIIEDGIAFHPALDIEWQKSIPLELQKEVRTKWEWLLANVWKINPNIIVHCRVYYFRENTSRLYVYFKERGNLIKWRIIRSVSRK